MMTPGSGRLESAVTTPSPPPQNSPQQHQLLQNGVHYNISGAYEEKVSFPHPKQHFYYSDHCSTASPITTGFNNFSMKSLSSKPLNHGSYGSDNITNSLAGELSALTPGSTATTAASLPSETGQTSWPYSHRFAPAMSGPVSTSLPTLPLPPCMSGPLTSSLPTLPLPTWPSGAMESAISTSSLPTGLPPPMSVTSQPNSVVAELCTPSSVATTQVSTNDHLPTLPSYFSSLGPDLPPVTLSSPSGLPLSMPHHPSTTLSLSSLLCRF